MMYKMSYFFEFEFFDPHNLGWIGLVETFIQPELSKSTLTPSKGPSSSCSHRLTMRVLLSTKSFYLKAKKVVSMVF